MAGAAMVGGLAAIAMVPLKITFWFLLAFVPAWIYCLYRRCAL